MLARMIRPVPTRINASLATLVILVHLAALMVLPAIRVVPAGMLIAMIAIASLGTPTHWALIHEAIHGVLLPGRAANEWLARVLAILFGVPFRAVRFAHPFERDLGKRKTPSDDGQQCGRQQAIGTHGRNRGLRVDHFERSSHEKHRTEYEPRGSRDPCSDGGEPRFGGKGNAHRDRSTNTAKSCLSAAIGVPGVQSTTPELRLNPMTCAECPTSYPPLGSRSMP